MRYTVVRGWRRFGLVLLALALAACSSVKPWINSPAAGTDLPPRLQAPLGTTDAARAERFHMTMAITLSGGGARAAAFGYGVLDALRQTSIRWNGREGHLLEEVDMVSGVSGGSIIAAYFAAFGEQTFPRFEQEFLNTPFQDDLISLIVKPVNLIDLSSPWFGRTHLLQRRLDELYHGLSFGDLQAMRGRPQLLVSATDLSLGSSFEFTPEQFGLICSDLSGVPLSFAVAASSAVPIALSPVTLRNYAGSCPAPQEADIPDGPGSYLQRLQRAQAHSYLDARARPYIHLVDGGVSDNLGVRRLLERTIGTDGLRASTRDLPHGTIHKLVLITVNAERDPTERIDQLDTVPTVSQVVDAMLFGAGARSTQETLGLLNDVAQQWKRELASAAGNGENAFAEDADIHVITVNLRDAPDPLERSRLLQVPTAFSISPEEVRRLIEAAHQVLYASPEYQRLLRSVDGSHPTP